MLQTYIIDINKHIKKNMETETVFTTTAMNNECNIDLLQYSLFGIQYTYSSKFSIGLSTSETPLFHMGWSCIILFTLILSASPNLTHEMNLQFRKQEKVMWNSVWLVCKVLHLYKPIFYHKLLFKNINPGFIFFSKLPLTSSSIYCIIHLFYKLFICIFL